MHLKPSDLDPAQWTADELNVKALRRTGNDLPRCRDAYRPGSPWAMPLEYRRGGSRSSLGTARSEWAAAVRMDRSGSTKGTSQAIGAAACPEKMAPLRDGRSRARLLLACSVSAGGLPRTPCRRTTIAPAFLRAPAPRARAGGSTDGRRDPIEFSDSRAAGSRPGDSRSGPTALSHPPEGRTAPNRAASPRAPPPFNSPFPGAGLRQIPGFRRRRKAQQRARTRSPHHRGTPNRRNRSGSGGGQTTDTTWRRVGSRSPELHHLAASSTGGRPRRGGALLAVGRRPEDAEELNGSWQAAGLRGGGRPGTQACSRGPHTRSKRDMLYMPPIHLRFNNMSDASLPPSGDCRPARTRVDESGGPQ